jgi:hypothetical protein
MINQQTSNPTTLAIQMLKEASSKADAILDEIAGFKTGTESIERLGELEGMLRDLDGFKKAHVLPLVKRTVDDGAEDYELSAITTHMETLNAKTEACNTAHKRIVANLLRARFGPAAILAEPQLFDALGKAVFQRNTDLLYKQASFMNIRATNSALKEIVDHGEVEDDHDCDSCPKSGSCPVEPLMKALDKVDANANELLQDDE